LHKCGREVLWDEASQALVFTANSSHEVLLYIGVDWRSDQTLDFNLSL